jgi:hypothetical protein
MRMTSPRPKSKQSQSFINKARELGCDEDPKAFERTFSKIVPPKKPAAQKPKKASRHPK